MTTPHEFHETYKASEVLAKIGNGSADADFARAMHLLIARVNTTHKGGKIVLTIEVKPRDDLGFLEFRAAVEAKVPKLPQPTSQMHLGPDGSLLSQMDFLMGGGRTEAPAPLKGDGGPSIGTPAPVSSASGRLPVVPLAKAPALAPVAATPAPAPLAPTTNASGKDAAAGKD